VCKAEQQRQAAAKLASQRKEMADYRRKQAEADAERNERERVTVYWESLTANEQAKLEAKIEAQSDPASIDLPDGPFKEMGMQIRREEFLRELLRATT
jgi:hypothetical protein